MVKAYLHIYTLQNYATWRHKMRVAEPDLDFN